MLTLEQGAAVLDVSSEFIRRRIKKGEINARFRKGSPKLGYGIDRSEFVRFLRSIGEEERATAVETGWTPQGGPEDSTPVLN